MGNADGAGRDDSKSRALSLLERAPRAGGSASSGAEDGFGGLLGFKPTRAQLQLAETLRTRPDIRNPTELCEAAGVGRTSLYRWQADERFNLWAARLALRHVRASGMFLLIRGMQEALAGEPQSTRLMFSLLFNKRGLAAIDEFMSRLEQHAGLVGPTAHVDQASDVCEPRLEAKPRTIGELLRARQRALVCMGQADQGAWPDGSGAGALGAEADDAVKALLEECIGAVDAQSLRALPPDRLALAARRLASARKQLGVLPAADSAAEGGVERSVWQEYEQVLAELERRGLEMGVDPPADLPASALVLTAEDRSRLGERVYRAVEYALGLVKAPGRETAPGSDAQVGTDGPGRSQ